MPDIGLAIIIQVSSTIFDCLGSLLQKKVHIDGEATGDGMSAKTLCRPLFFCGITMYVSVGLVCGSRSRLRLLSC